MRQKIRYIGLLLICTLLMCAGTVSAKEITVSTSSGNSTITAALANATDGDTIIVTAGTYTENVIVNQSVTIHSQSGAENTIVTAKNSSHYTFSVTANNVTIDGFNVTGATGYHNAGIYLHEFSNCTISNNTITGNYYNIYLNQSNNNHLIKNSVLGSRYGILLHNSSLNTLTQNAMSLNDYSLLIRSSSAENYNNDIAADNLVDGKPVYYLVNCSDMIVPSNASLVYAINSSNITVSGVEISNQYYGMMFFETDNSTIENSMISNCLEAIVLEASNNNTLANNNASSNEFDGIYLVESNNNTLTNNTANDNWIFDGISLYSSNNNILTNNNASSNYEGIGLYTSGNNTLINNSVSSGHYGIYIYNGSSNTLAQNTISDNQYNFYVGGALIEHFYNDIASSNSVDDKPVYYLLNCSDMTVPSDAGQVFAVNSTNITLKDISISNAYSGISFLYTNNSTIENVTLSQNYYGIYLANSTDNTLNNNTIASNSWDGISLYSSSNNNTIENNTISSGACDGIYLDNSGNNTLNKNTIIDNLQSGINLYQSENNSVLYNTLTNNTYNGLFLNLSDYSTLTNNNITTSGLDGINITLSNYTLVGYNNVNSNTDYGIHLNQSNSNNMTDNIINDNGYGFFLMESDNNTISGNNATFNAGGIQLELSNSNTLTNNNISNSNSGILLHYSSSNTLSYTTMSDNRYNFYVYGNSTEYYYNDIDTTNSVDGNPVYYLVNSSDVIVPSDASVLYAVNSTNITVSGARISNQPYGIMFLETDNSNIINVTVSDCFGGIILGTSNNNSLTDNNISSSFFENLYLSESNNNTLINNNVSDGYYGISLLNSSSNTLSQNTMSDNQYNFYIGGASTEYFYNGIDTTNSVDQKPVYYLVNSSDTIIPSGAGLAYAINSTNITVADAQISNVAWGVLFVETQNSTIDGVTVSDCDYGIILDNSDNNTLTDNTIIDNDYDGIYVEDSVNNTLLDNIAKNNYRYDLWLGYGSTFCEVNDLTVTENGAQLSFIGDYTETAIKGSALNSTALSGKTNVNGYVIIERQSATDIWDTSFSLSALAVNDLSTDGFAFAHDCFIGAFEPSATPSSVAYDGIDVNTRSIPPLPVTFSYDDSGMSSSGESSIDLYVFNASTWEAVNGTSLDTSNNSISVSLSDFGTFALFKTPEASGSHSSNPTGGDFNIRLPDEDGQSQETVTTTTTTLLSVNSDGEVTGDTVVESSDSATTLTLYEGTVGTDSSGNPVTKITISKPSSMPENTPDAVLESGLYYDYGPSGTTFSKEVMISIEFDPADYEGRDPVIYTYSEEEGWIALETTIDWENGVATAYTRHFSLYALFGNDGEVTEDMQVPAQSSEPVEEVPVDEDGSSGYLYWILGICVIIGLGIVVVNKQKKEE